VSESDVQASIAYAVNASGLGYVWRNQSGGTRVRGGFMQLAPTGSPDLVGWTRTGRFLGIEVKAPGAKTAKARAVKQLEWRERIREAGGVAMVASSAAEAIAALVRSVRP
jgi:VRR-NUC domain